MNTNPGMWFFMDYPFQEKKRKSLLQSVFMDPIDHADCSGWTVHTATVVRFVSLRKKPRKRFLNIYIYMSCEYGMWSFELMIKWVYKNERVLPSSTGLWLGCAELRPAEAGLHPPQVLCCYQESESDVVSQATKDQFCEKTGAWLTNPPRFPYC